MKNMADDRRSLRTRQSLMEALLSLLDEVDYDHITIQDIVDRANVGRSTFYAHYEDKDDLLASGFNAMLEKLVEHIDLVQNEGGIRFDVTMLFRHAEGHFRLYRALTWGSGLKILTQQGYSGLSSRIEERFASLIDEGQTANVPLPVVAQHTAGSLLILLKWWLDQKMPFSDEEMNGFFQQLVMPGVGQVLQGGDENLAKRKASDAKKRRQQNRDMNTAARQLLQLYETDSDLTDVISLDDEEFTDD